MIGTISGFGSSVFFVPVAAYFFDFHSVLGITAIFHVFSNLSKIYFFKRGVNWNIVLYLGIPAIIFVSIGAYLSKFFDSTLLELILAVFLIGFSILFLIAQNVIIKPTHTNSIIGGSISGFVAGLLGTGGTIRGMTLAAFNLNKDVFIATSAFIDFGVDLSRGIVYFSNGYMHWHDMKFVLILIAVSIVGTYIGKKVLDRVSETTFKRIVLFVILGIGITTLMQQIL
ncbi:MAG: sulfite exporter TauE/SafE family protein [Crocinitomicaceae bacterium]|nr:sulfite exporter TauE/SafE family protein [Crocinitomicaceae bacterium]